MTDENADDEADGIAVRHPEAAPNGADAAVIPTRPTRGTTALLAVLAAAVVLLLTPLPATWSVPWVGALMDLGHLPLMAGLTVALSWFGGMRPPVAFGIALAIGVGGELGQSLVGRSSSAEDVLRNLCGALIGCVLLRPPAGRAEWAGQGALVALLVLAPVVRAWPALADGHRAYVQFPALLDPSVVPSPLRARIYRADASATAAGLRLAFRPGTGYAGMELRTVVTDWTGYGTLTLDLSLPEPLRLNLVIPDYREAKEHGDRFNASRSFAAGEHRWTIPLADVAAAPRTTPLDLAQVRFLNLFVGPDGGGRSLTLKSVTLR